MALSGAKYEMSGLGQFGSIFTDGTTALVPPTDFIITAISFLSDTTFTALDAENSAADSRVFPQTTNAAHASGAGNEGTGGLAVANTDTFPQGVVIYGRWKGLQLNSGSVIAYLAPKH